MNFVKTVIILIILSTLQTVLAQEELQADATSYASGTGSADAGVLVSVGVDTATAEAQASSSSDIASSETVIITSGQQVESHSLSISDNTGSIAVSSGSSIGDIISLLSWSSAIGIQVYGEGTAFVTGTQSASAGVVTQIETLDNGLYQITVKANGEGTGDASGTVYTLAWAFDPSKVSVLEPIALTIVEPRPFMGFTFGKCDVQRYKHFWMQLRDDNLNNDARALYWMEMIASDHTNYPPSSDAMSSFEDKYNITNNTPPDGLDGNGDKYGKWCKLPE